MVNHMEDDVGLVHQMPFVCDREGFPATLEKVGHKDLRPRPSRQFFMPLAMIWRETGSFYDRFLAFIHTLPSAIDTLYDRFVRI